MGSTSDSKIKVALNVCLISIPDAHLRIKYDCSEGSGKTLSLKNQCCTSLTLFVVQFFKPMNYCQKIRIIKKSTFANLQIFVFGIIYNSMKHFMHALSYKMVKRWNGRILELKIIHAPLVTSLTI